MAALTHPATGHRISTDDASVGFWQAAGYQVEKVEAPAKRAAAKKSSTTKK